MKIHPSDLLLAEAAKERSGHRRLFEHVESCAWCRQRLKAVLSHHLERKPPEYGPILDRSFRSLQRWEAEYASERAEAPALLSTLLNMPRGRQEMVLRNHRRFQTWGLLELLLSESRERVFDDPSDSEDLATLGLELARFLDSSNYGIERIEDLKARALALLGNSRRVWFEVGGAELAFGEAYRHLAAGTRDFLERAMLLEFEASLWRLQRRFGDSLRLLRRAEATFKELEDSHAVGRCKIQVSIVHYHKGEFDTSIGVLRRAIPLIDQTLDPRSLFFAWHNLINCTTMAGHSILEAQAMLAKARPLYQSFPQAWAQGRLKWMEGRIARRTGRHLEATAFFSAARLDLMAANLKHEAALVSEEIRGVTPLK
jgi:tetratricopeptide (TPR) repeat protein